MLFPRSTTRSFGIPFGPGLFGPGLFGSGLSVAAVFVGAALALAGLVGRAGGTVRPAAPQESGYYEHLRDTLEEQYGLTGGVRVLGGSGEAEVLDRGEPAGVDTVREIVTGRPFRRSVRLEVAEAGPNAWSRTIRFPTSGSIAEGDVLLLAFWVRGRGADGGVARAAPLVEKTSDPYTKSLATSFAVPDEWRRVLLPFTAAGSYAPGEVRFQLNVAAKRQEIVLAGPAMLNFEDAYAESELPTERPPQTYDGRALDASWRARAEARIDTHRTAELRVSVVDESGRAVKGAEVEVRMQEHAFGFGTAVAVDLLVGAGRNETYRAHLADLTGDGRSFNVAVIENALKWPTWENSDWPADRAGTVDAVDWLRERGMEVRGHNLVWPGWTYLPDDLAEHSDDPGYLRDRIRSHIEELAGYDGIRGRLVAWDVINEPVHNKDLAEALPEGEDAYVDWFRWAEEADTAAALYLNDYNMISEFGALAGSDRAEYLDLADRLRSAGASLDGLGLQGHFAAPLPPIDTVEKVLERFGETGLELSITEYDVAGVSESVAADYTRDLLTLAYSMPAVEGFLMWGFWDGAHWKENAPIFRKDWTMKPAGEVFVERVFETWWTEATLTSDADGLAATRGHLGEYEIRVTEEGRTATRTVRLVSGGTDVEIALPAATAVGALAGESEVPTRFVLAKNRPNPFNPGTVIRFGVPEPAPVTLRVYDVLGREVSVLLDRVVEAGWHRVSFRPERLPAGVYVYRLTSGSIERSRTMVLAK